ncbi:dihydroneopterin aldolase [Halocynthiibacter sp. C4]|uniref:dihydroneopterin aldolase n=1 Tax=Halocynthiibacter sp. C4 TaxID=2992758 RepID=UPI00237B93EA|nr:dihydroneopterin aldolase [Halocynthiibacter sp. C4]MDE0590112.1 dihydroneopterin aldolase [Halocynthiibacter sp. C4]
MSDEISVAFAHPEARSRAHRPDGKADRISLRDHIVTVEIGAFEVERGIEQRLSFNVVVEVADVPQPLEDDVDRILSYDRLTEAIAEALAAQRVNLLETLAQDIAERILREPQAERVYLRIEKLDKPAGVLGVEIVREAGGARSEKAETRAKPVIAVAGCDLDAVRRHYPGQPILLVPPANAPLPEAEVGEEAARRIALFAWDQAAWIWAAGQADVTVVSSRTEVEWGIAQGQVNIWAPMKQILDSPTPPKTLTTQSLARWISGVLEGEVAEQ